MTAVTPNAQATDAASLARHFGGHDVLPLWIAEPYVDLAPAVVQALDARARVGWYGYETRPPSLLAAFWEWMSSRHGWDGSELHAVVSPSVGTSIGVLLDLWTGPGDGVILQPPVFTEFKPTVVAGGRTVVRNALQLSGGRYTMDVDGLAELAAESGTRAMILCNPHNPVGRVWTRGELAEIAAICARHGVFVIADEIHADIVLSPHRFTPFAEVATDVDVRWAALHGPVKTFGLAGVADSLVITSDDVVAERFADASARFHLGRNNVFGLVAFEAAYRAGAVWFDDLLGLVDQNLSVIASGLPDAIELTPTEGTFLAWLDFRPLGMDVPELADWLAASARLGLSPGHWFGREGAGFARMTVAAPTEQIDEAVVRLAQATDALT
jgi:cystathionine beta-lyase